MDFLKMLIFLLLLVPYSPSEITFFIHSIISKLFNK
nr:MAG TPA: Protein of unknown function (DUF4014) [Caudoviricetes sp.]